MKRFYFNLFVDGSYVDTFSHLADDVITAQVNVYCYLLEHHIICSKDNVRLDFIASYCVSSENDF